MCHQIDCGHPHSAHHGMSEHGYHPRGCCGTSGHGIRRFPTREEIITQLDEYLKQLQAEAKGVEERLAELRKED